MDGQHTIIVTLQFYFRVTVEDVFDEICQVVLFNLNDGSEENPPKAEDMEAEIDALAWEFEPDNQGKRDIIKNDLLKLVTSWWHTVTWTRQKIRLSIEKEEFIADLLAPIVKEIINSGRKQYYDTSVLKALLQKSMPQNGITCAVPRFLAGINLNTALDYYQRLSEKYGFGKQYRILLELLSMKMARNEQRHLYYLYRKYKADCYTERKQPSYDDYISCRGLTIPQEQSVICENLFKKQLDRGYKAFSFQTC